MVTQVAPPGPSSPLGFRVRTALKKNFLNTLAEFRDQYGDVVSFFSDGELRYHFFSPDDVNQLLVNHHDALERQEGTTPIFQTQGINVVTAEGASWKRQRRILLPAFSSKKMSDYLGLMRDATEESILNTLLDPKAVNQPVNVKEFASRITLNVILRILFSYRASNDEQRALIEAVHHLSRQGLLESLLAQGFLHGFPFPSKMRRSAMNRTLDALIAGQIESHQQEGQTNSDIVSTLLAARDEEAPAASGEQHLTRQEIHDNCRLIFFVGHDPAASILTWLIGLLCKHPQYAIRIRQELHDVVGDREIQYGDLLKLTLLPATIKETMRLYPAAVAIMPRRVIHDFSFNGWDIKKGTLLNLPIWLIHHDARWFPEPEVFMPERFLPDAPKPVKGTYAPFGGGPRICLGQQFATSELTLIAATLLRRFDFIVAKDFVLPEATMALSFEPAAPMHVRFSPRT